MFKRENRLTPKVKFNNSQSIANSQFILKNANNKLDVNRFGIVVSKKIDNRAVGRNKIKRLLRNALVNINKKMSTGHDILLIIRKGFLDKTKEENLLLIESSLEKAGLIKK
jgi:ribonuclease P protein component